MIRQYAFVTALLGTLFLVFNTGCGDDQDVKKTPEVVAPSIVPGIFHLWGSIESSTAPGYNREGVPINLYWGLFFDGYGTYGLGPLGEPPLFRGTAGDGRLEFLLTETNPVCPKEAVTTVEATFTPTEEGADLFILVTWNGHCDPESKNYGPWVERLAKMIAVKKRHMAIWARPQVILQRAGSTLFYILIPGRKNGALLLADNDQNAAIREHRLQPVSNVLAVDAARMRVAGEAFEREHRNLAFA